jgi:hypothetical protein
VIKAELKRVSSPALYSGHAWSKRSRVVTRGSFPKLTGRELTPLQGQGRAQIVVEPKQELPFEIARGARGERRSVVGAPTRPVSARNRGLPSFAKQFQEKTTRRRISPTSVIEG